MSAADKKGGFALAPVTTSGFADFRNCGKMRLINSSRSSCMSRKVDDTNTRITRCDDSWPRALGFTLTT